MITIDNIVVDVATSVDESHDAQVTKFPISNGSNIADHVIPGNVKLTIKGVVSDTPLIDVSDFRTGVASPSNEVKQLLIDLEKTPRAVDVVTPSKTYKGLVLTGLSFGDDKDRGDALTFDATFEEIQIAQTRLVVSKSLGIRSKSKALWQDDLSNNSVLANVITAGARALLTPEQQAAYDAKVAQDKKDHVRRPAPKKDSKRPKDPIWGPVKTGKTVTK